MNEGASGGRSQLKKIVAKFNTNECFKFLLLTSAIIHSIFKLPLILNLSRTHLQTFIKMMLIYA